MWEATRARVATEGFGARLLALQDPDGQWAGGAFFPKDFDFHGPEAADGAGQPWTATTWTLNTLREWGLDAAALAGTADRLAANSRWEYDNLPYWGGEVDCCINAYTLANGAWLGADVAGIAQWFLDHRLADGGWNCEWVNGSTRSSFHSTLNTLKGLLSYEVATGGSDALRAARRAGEEYLLRAPADAPVVDRRARRAVGDALRVPVPLVLQRAERGGLLPRCGPARRHRARPPPGGGDRRRSAPPAVPTAPGCRSTATPDGCGSRSTCRPASRRSGSRSPAPACSRGGTRRARPPERGALALAASATSVPG